STICRRRLISSGELSTSNTCQVPRPMTGNASPDTGIFRVIIDSSSASESAGSRPAAIASLMTSRLVQISVPLMQSLRKPQVPSAVFPPDPEDEQGPRNGDGYTYQRNSRQPDPGQRTNRPRGKHITTPPYRGLYEILCLVLGFPRNHGVEHVACRFRQAVLQAAPKHLAYRYDQEDRVRCQKCESDGRHHRQNRKRHADADPL